MRVIFQLVGIAIPTLSATAQDEAAVGIEHDNGVCSLGEKGDAKESSRYERRGILCREGFIIDDHEQPITPILTPPKVAIAKCEDLHRNSASKARP